MKQEIKIFNEQERQAYVPVRVEVIEVTLLSTILTGSKEQYDEDTWEN